MEKETKLKNPIELIIEPRMSGGLLCAVANTVDEGCASVVWDFKDKSWIFAKGLPVGTVFAAAPASTEVLMHNELPAVNISSNMEKEAPPNEEIIYLDKHGKKMQPPPTLDLKNFTWKKFIKWLNYIWSEKIF